MKIYNQDKTEIIENPDLEKGYLILDKIFVETLPAIKEVFHYEVMAEYPNGCKDLKRVIDVEGRQAQDIYENIQVYIPYTEQELYQIEFAQLKNWFSSIYTYQEQKYRRLSALGINDDDGIDCNTKLNALYEEAEVVRKRIQELELLIIKE